MPKQNISSENACPVSGSAILMQAKGVPLSVGSVAAVMYFGSVKFFKHLIYTVVFGWIAVATFLAVFFGVKYFIGNSKAAEVNASYKENHDTNTIPEDASFETLFLIMTAQMASNGYSTEDILAFIRDNESEEFNKFVEEYVSENPDAFQEIKDEAGSPSSAAEEDNSAEYTKLYPDLYADSYPESFQDDNGTIYLTFDDGPSKNTEEILYILNRYDIKATFFFNGGTDETTMERMKAVADAGHSVGIHSISHDYEKVYESVESYLADFNDTYNCIYEATGIKPQIFRFPGGSINNYNRFVYMQIIAEMTRRGFVYYDWNVSGEDAVHGANWTSIYNNVMTGIQNNSADRAIVLLHDADDKYATVMVLEDVIEALLRDGYSFGQIDTSVKPVTFSYTD